MKRDFGRENCQNGRGVPKIGRETTMIPIRTLYDDKDNTNYLWLSCTTSDTGL
jgi:hypothetical protein